MTIISEVDRAGHEQAARTTLEWTVANGKPFAPILAVYREGRIRAYVVPPSGDGAVIRFTGQLAVQLFRVDAIVTVSDTYHAERPINPVTNQDWREGEMQDVAENHHGLEEGWVAEALVIGIQNKAGENALVELVYTRAGDVVVWGERTVFDSSTDQVKGRLFEMFEKPEGMPPTPPGMDDKTAGMMLTISGAMVAVSEYADES